MICEVRGAHLPPPHERRRIREQAHFSLRDMAGVLLVTAPTVHAWERGTSTPRRANAVAYRALLDQLREAAPNGA